MKRLLYPLMALPFLVMSCTENIDMSSRYVFEDYTVASYLEKHAETYSEFLELAKQVTVSPISETTVYQLLTARGNFTCFVPTNEAIDSFLVTLVDEGMIDSPSWDAFTDAHKLDSIRQVVVKNSVIDGGDLDEQRIMVNGFSNNGNTKMQVAIPNMKDRRLSYVFDKGTLLINDCVVDPDNRDIEVINGVVHQLHGVISPKEITAATYMESIIERNEPTGFLLFSKAVLACGLKDTMNAIRDEVYETKYLRGEIPIVKNYHPRIYPSDMTDPQGKCDAIPPEHRNYGLTFFAEKDEFWMEQGIDPTAPDALDQLQQWIVDNEMYPANNTYVSDHNYTSEHNMLHQWLTYHVLPMKLLPDQLVYHCNELGYSIAAPTKISLPCPEWYPCYGERRLLKLYDSDKSNGIYLNRFANRNNGRLEDGKERDCDPDKVGCKILTGDSLVDIENIVNACIYPIDAPLAYNEHTRTCLSQERIRFDGMALFPEAATNYIRRAKGMEDKYNHVYIPDNVIYQYFDNMSIMSENSYFIYFNGHGWNWPLFSQDEMKAVGRYDIMFTLPPVPTIDTYELRYKILATGVRGVVQVYFGDDPNNLPVAGIPIDLRKDISKYVDGAWKDTGDEDVDAEMDRNLRNHGFMKAGLHEDGGSGGTRESGNNLRFIVARQTMYPNKTYYVRFKSVLDSETSEFHLDYFELCPKVIYDNPETPEDIW